MPIIERVVGKKGRGQRTSYKTAGHMKNIMKYILDSKKTEDYLTGCVNMIDPKNAFNEFSLMKMVFNKMPETKEDTTKRMVVHFVQSFDVKDKVITHEIAKKIADEFANSIYFKDYQVVYAVHKDTKHIHTHYIVNTTNIRNGKSWQQSKKDLEGMKKLSDEISLKYGVSIIEESSRNRGKHRDNSEVHADRRGASWKKEIFHKCMKAKKQANNIEEFVDLLKGDGIQVRMSSSRKDITYILNDKKINSDKLGFPKRGFTPFTKEELAKEFERKKISREKVKQNTTEKAIKNEGLYITGVIKDIERFLSKDEADSSNKKDNMDSSNESERKRLKKKEENKKAKGIVL